MTGMPWFRFYPADWRADPALRFCSLAARGLWIEMIAIMHEATPRGCLLVNGNPVTSAQLASLVGASCEDVEALLAELETAGVFSRKRNGVIYSRRMERDENRSRKNRDNGKMGGNPTLCKITENEASDNPEDKALETRSQKPEEKTSSAAALDGEFQVWYEVYPRKVGRGQAVKAYRGARRKADAETLLRGAQEARHRYRDSDPNFIPHPSTWLNGERWLDQPATQQRAEPHVPVAI